MGKERDNKSHKSSNSTNQETNINSNIEKESIKNVIKDLITKYNITKEDFSSLFEIEDSTDLPISIFNNTKLSGLETITKYLREDKKLKFSEIAFYLHRDSRTIWSAYHTSQKKFPASLEVKKSDIKIPLNKLSDRSFSILESLVAFLKNNYHLSLHEIAVLLKRNDRTIWTVLSRYKQKGGVVNE